MEIPKVVMQMQMFNQIINYTAASICRLQMNYEGSSLSGRVGKFHLKSNYKRIFHVLYFFVTSFGLNFHDNFPFSILKFFGFCLSSFYVDDSDCYGLMYCGVDKRF